jgi:hypothetical protein
MKDGRSSSGVSGGFGQTALRFGCQETRLLGKKLPPLRTSRLAGDHKITKQPQARIATPARE